MRLARFIMLSCAMAVALAGCSSRGPSQSTAGPAEAPSPTPVPTALPPVEAAPQTTLPPGVLSVSPRGEAKDGSQIRVRFANDIVPVEALESTDRQEALSHFSIEPPLPGHFIFLTPRMVGFEADAPVPHATRVRVTISAGLTDLPGRPSASVASTLKLPAGFVWSFTTAPLTLTSLPNPDPSTSPAAGERLPRIGIDASDPIDVASLIAHAKLIDRSDTSKTIAIEPAPSPSPDPSAEATVASDAGGADPGSTTTHYDFVPAQTLAYDRTYELQISPGVAPAGGNVATASTYLGHIRTYGALSFTGVNYGSSERFDTTAPSLAFSNPIDSRTLAKAITISPAPAGGMPLFAADESGSVSINPDALAPDTSYVATVATTLADTFGQTLGSSASAHFRTGDLAANISAPVGSRIFPTGVDLGIDVQTVNLPERSFRGGYKIVQPTDLIARDFDQQDDVSALGPGEAQWTPHAVAQTKNVEKDSILPLRSMLGGATGTIAYAYSARTTQTKDENGKLVWQTPEFHGALQVTNLGVFTQWFPDGGFVRVRRLGDGSVVRGAHVDVYESTAALADKPKTSGTPCASGTTGSDGTWAPSATAWAACASTAASADEAPALLTIVHDGTDWSYARSGSYENGYDVGLSGEGWSAGTPNARGSLISDRTLYQPGETAKFVGVSYFERDGTIGRGRSTSFAITATSPSGATTSLGAGSPDAFGAFPVTLAIPKNAAVGSWQIAGKGQSGETLSGSFTVAEFKPPNFKVDLTLDEKPVPAGTAVPVASKSLYLFGAPVAGGTSHVSVTRSRTDYAPDGFEAYSFGRTWVYPEREPDVSSDVLQTDVAVDANGDAPASVPVAADLPFPMTYTVTTQTTDVSNLAVADTKSFTALPSDVSIGLKAAFVSETGKPFDVSVVTVGLDGKAVSGRSIKLTLQQRLDASATEIVAGGGESAREDVRYVDVATRDVTTGERAVSASFSADKPGDYRVRANFADAAGDATATDASLWVTGPGEASWISSENSALGVKLDKNTYRPGDTAHVLVQSPYANAEMFVAVVRHGVILQRTTLVHGAAPEATFEVTKDMLPNAAVQAVLVRRGAPLSHGVPHGLDKLSRIGFATFEVALDSKYVNVDVHPASATVLPAAHERVSFHMSGKDGSAAHGEFAVAVVNDAILQLSGYRFPDLVKTVYADEPISTRLADNYDDVKLQNERHALDKGFGFGGGVMAGPANTRVRKKFLPLAYFNAGVHADANGNATIDIPLPDDLTTWRVMAIGLTSDARFGNGEATFVTTKPLVTDPILPQFARPGDRFAAGVSITNIAHQSGDVAVKADLSGGATFATGAPATAQTSAPGSAATQAIRFDVVAGGPADASFTMHTSLGANADAFTFGVPILSDDAIESAITTGATENTVSVPLTVAPELKGPLGGLDVTVASTLLAEALEPTKTLMHDPFAFATELGSRIAVASDAIVLDRTYGRTADIPDLRASATRDLNGLRALALADGGFAQWPGAKSSEIYTTSFVVQQLLQARAAGIDVDSDLTHALAFERKALANPVDIEGISKDDKGSIAEARLETLETLGAAGDVRSDFLGDVWDQRENFSFYEQVEFARFLVRLPAWHDRGIALRDTLFQRVNLGARHATVDLRGGFGESETAGQAQMLGLAIASATPTEDVDRLLESLLALRHDGRWGCTCDDAEAMNGIVLYAAQNAQPPDFVATLQLPAKTAQTRTHTFRGYAVTTATDTIPMDGLERGAGHVVLRKDGRGTLHYAVALRYRVPDAVPGIYEGLRIDRIVRAAGDPAGIATFGLVKPSGPTSVAASHVFDIEDRIIVDHPVEDVLVIDPLPAGFEAVDQSFRTSAPGVVESDDSLSVDYQSIYRNRVLSFVSHLEPGAYAIHYLVRSVTPGTFAWPGATAQLQYEPEQFGRTAASQLEVTP